MSSTAQDTYHGIESKARLLDKNLLEFITNQEIDEGIQKIAEYLRQKRVATVDGLIATINSTPYRDKITLGSLGSFIEFLQSFQNNRACGFRHEMGAIVNGIMLRPENCQTKEGYTGCGHPELNGAILAIAIGRALLQKNDTHGYALSLSEENFWTNIKLDGLAFNEYSRGQKRGTKEIRILDKSSTADLQSMAGEALMNELHALAKRIVKLYDDTPQNTNL